MIIKLDDKDDSSVEVSELEIVVLGLTIYENSIKGNNSLRDKLLDYFIEKTRNDFNDLEYNFNIEIQYHTNNYGQSIVPKLLINTSNVETVKDMSRVLYTLREYFQIRGNLRLATEPYYQDGVDEEGYPVIKYFKRNDDSITLVLDFTEYKCNEVYKKSVNPLNRK